MILNNESYEDKDSLFLHLLMSGQPRNRLVEVLNVH